MVETVSTIPELRAAKAYAEDVQERRFPELQHCFGVPKEK